MVDAPIDILLVEDHEMDILLIEEALKRTGSRWALSVVRDGVEAMDYLRGLGSFGGAPRPGLILLDLKMPRKDGREVLAEIKADEVLQSIPVIVLTSSDDPDDVVQAYRLGANSYVRKPLDLESLKALMKALEDFWFQRVTLPSEPKAVRAIHGSAKRGCVQEDPRGNDTARARGGRSI
jgi:two-component system, chemotaxis family, response regulator Rcp1